MVFFDILSEDCLQRKCRLTFHASDSKKWIKSPILAIPVNDYLLQFTSFKDYLVRNHNVILQIFNPDQNIPEELSDFDFICGTNSNYYSKDGGVESFFGGKRESIVSIDAQKVNRDISKISKNLNVLPIISKNCPSVSLNEKFSFSILTSFEKEFLDQIDEYEKKGILVEDFGIAFDFYNENTFTPQIDKIIEMLNNPKIIEHVKLLKLSGIFDNLMNFKEIMDAIINLKERIPSDIILMASGKITPVQYSFLIYLGFDIIDGSYLLYSGFSDLYWTGSDMIWARQIRSMDYLSCSCSFCENLTENFNKDPSEIDKFGDKIINHFIAFHNLSSGINEMKKVRAHIKEGNLRYYLEKRSMNSTFLISAIRYMDNRVPNIFSKNQTLNKNSRLICSGPMSYKEPQVVRFQNLIKENVYPNSDIELCVFLPCSMVKPYSKSKSHRKFIKIIKSATSSAGLNYDKILQVIVTSPLGIVPRFIEEIYPAAHYDISVTGEWDNEEIEMTADCISSWIEKIPTNIPLLAHLSKGYKQAFEKGINSLKNHNNNNRIIRITEELNDFEQNIVELMQISKENDNGNSMENKRNRIDDSLSIEEREIKSIADFQFGKGAGKLLIGSSARFFQSRDERYKEIYGYESYGKILLGRYHRNSGHIQLTYQGGQRLVELKANSLILNTDDLQGSTVFKPAIDSISPGLCSGDEVLILNPNGNYIGIGTMVVNAETGMKLRRGAIAKIRKMRKI